MDLFSKDWFYQVFFRYAHVLSGITWIGLLYYFNVVQVPAFAQMEAAARTDAIRKLASRALWWFRWGAASTVAFGILLISVAPDTGDYFKTIQGMAIFLGIIFGLTMAANVWMVIWPNQKIVIGNAERVAAGQEPDPRLADAQRRAALASRTNTFLSITMLFFMIVAGHGGYSSDADFLPGGGKRAFWFLLVLAWTAVVEANALGYLGGTGVSPTRKFLDTHKDTLIYASVHAVLWIILFQIFFAWS
jgi:uncharacterized membrane protein